MTLTGVRESYLSLFMEEFEVLQHAKAELAGPSGADKSFTAEQYETMVSNYEKLLKTTMKLSRISDIQWEKLIRTEQEIKLANENLSRLEQLRRHLITDISHELGTPMATVQGYVKALLDGVIEPHASYLQMIYDKIVLMDRLIKDLFQLSTLQANEKQFDLGFVLLTDWFGFIRDKFYLASKGTISFALDVSAAEQDGREIALKIDALRMEQVFTNLIYNALKYSPDGGAIDVRFTIMPNVSADNGAEAAEGEPSPELVLSVEVEDHGSGIEERDIPYVFDRFYRGSHKGKDAVSGTGLGLAITKEIISKHGGTIGVTSVIGQGSTFTFTLPAEWIGEP